MDTTILTKNRKSLGRQTLSRRDWIIASTAAAACLAWPTAANAQSGSKSKQKTISDDTGRFRVRAVLEVNGEIRLKSQSTDALSKSGKSLAAKTAPIKATSTVEFDEQFETTAQLLECRSYQHFHEANSEIQIDRHVTKTNLRENCRDIVRLGTNDGLVTACPDNPLFAAERDLIEGPINTMFLDQLLTDEEVNIADKWTIDNDVACRLLNMDAIHDGKLEVCLVDANKEKAQLEINGSISASVRQVPTTITIEGKAQLDRESGTISWLAMNLDETRDISEAEPGFHVVAQLKILRSKIEDMTSGLTLNDVASRVGSLDSASLLQFQSDHGYYRFIANRKWSTYRDNGEEATLRYIVNNRVVTQCNVTNMIDYEPGRQLSLEGFQADVRISVGKALLEIVESSERISGNKLRLLRVVSRGSVQGVDIQWIHYHISNDNGRRVVLTFTLNEANMEIFAEEDAQLAGSFELIDWPTKLDAKSVEAAAAADNPTDGKKSLIVPDSKTSTQPVRPKMAR